LRFTFSKDLKFIRGKVCKPYNSVLGEHFRAHWDIIPVSYSSNPRAPPIQHLYVAAAGTASSPNLANGGAVPSRVVAETDSIKSSRSGLSYISSFGRTTQSTPATSPELVQSNLDAQISDLSLGEDVIEADDSPSVSSVPRLRVIYITEQVSHHPPVSSYYASCPARHTELWGIDQISAKVYGTTLRVSPGSYNQGIFVKLTGGPGEGETYNITHPTAAVNGILRGNFYITVGDSTIITCTGGQSGQNLRAIIEYKEESWLGKAQYALEGVIHTYEEGVTQHSEWTKVKHVPKSRVVASFDGSWKGRIQYRLETRSYVNASPTSSTSTSKSDLTTIDDEWATLIDISALHAIPKSVRPLEKQLPTESRKLWQEVTSRLLKKDYGEATRLKQAIEQKQRDDAAERKRNSVEFIPKYFEKAIDNGIPQLTEEGRRIVEEELGEDST